ncbi:ArsR/SmtB family transcription factor [Parenemella sanctibonifatiensis]|uniref:Transcriptional regulator n=1 Tax=Parenemella sanctibonifatiensis TaxID=2016505 RepID=A0A255EMA8_9ACTN|nr:metalloregulator ArsR/SmtB family transcription factor [Parenemella sanctibonifatiensis]OYN92689.1 transcriptional regulator [Parenemella sanctibonifatiensis]
MDAFTLLAEPVRRRIVELLADEARAAGEVGALVQGEFGISQPAVSNQLRVLREAGAVEVEARGSRRIYRLRAGALDELHEWTERYARFWPQRLDALETELARGRRRPAQAPGTPEPPDSADHHDRHHPTVEENDHGPEHHPGADRIA